MKDLKIAISGYGSISSMGLNKDRIWSKYLDNKHCFQKKQFESGEEWVSSLSEECLQEVGKLYQEKKYQQLDPSVHYAIIASRIAVKQAGWQSIEDFGVNIGSSRGATHLFEKYHTEFIENGRQKVNPLCSPSTTLGNIASWVASDMNNNGPTISHSATCSTALQSIVNAISWLQSGLCKRFLAGGSEAPLTGFTIAQMKALKIYSGIEGDFPSQSMVLNKSHSSMILGEGAACFCLEQSSENALAYISGIGYGTELIKHGASLSTDAICLQKSMQMALKAHDPKSIDLIIMHSPGTILGDQSEMEAINAVFGNDKPFLTGNKWKIGHTLGASGALSLEMGLLMLQHNQSVQVPYLPKKTQPKSINKIMINAAGFGGTGISLIIEKNRKI